jgi:hypothetical protein
VSVGIGVAVGTSVGVGVSALSGQKYVLGAHIWSPSAFCQSPSTSSLFCCVIALPWSSSSNCQVYCIAHGTGVGASGNLVRVSGTAGAGTGVLGRRGRPGRARRLRRLGCTCRAIAPAFCASNVAWAIAVAVRLAALTSSL